MAGELLSDGKPHPMNWDELVEDYNSWENSLGDVQAADDMVLWSQYLLQKEDDGGIYGRVLYDSMVSNDQEILELVKQKKLKEAAKLMELNTGLIEKYGKLMQGYQEKLTE
jgi:hypothetical protein